MKRSWCFILWGAMFSAMVVLAPVSPAHAADPTPAPAAAALDAIPSDAVTTDNGTITRVDFPPQSYSFTDDNPLPELQSQAVTGESLKIPDFTDVNARLDTMGKWSMPAEFQPYLIDPKNKMYVSGKVAYCTDKNGHIKEQTSKRYVSKENDQLNAINNYATTLGLSYLPNYQRGLDENGSVLYKEQSVLVAPDASIPCDSHGETGEKVDTSTTETPFVEGGGLIARLVKWFEKLFPSQTGGQTKKSIIVKQNIPLARANPILIGQPGGGQSGLSTDEQNQLAKIPEGGVLGSFFAAEMKGPSGGHGAVENFSVDDPSPIPVNFTNVKTLINDETLLRCIGSPQEFAGTDSRPSDCGVTFQQATTSCTSTVDLGTPSCKLCNPDNIFNINNTFFHQSLPNGLPPTMIKIIEKAGEAYHVPPYSLLAVMFHEGGLTPASLKGEAWTEEKVQQWSVCGGTMPFCNPNDVATMPYGIQPQTWKDFQLDTAASDILPERKGKENICNFLDQTFGAAKRLALGEQSQLSSYISSTYIPDNKCFGVPLSTLQPPSTPSSCSWSELEVFRSHLQYAGYCPQTGKNAGFPDVNDQYKEWIDLFYNNFHQCN